jgi:hypothetical protein
MIVLFGLLALAVVIQSIQIRILTKCVRSLLEMIDGLNNIIGQIVDRITEEPQEKRNIFDRYFV